MARASTRKEQENGGRQQRSTQQMALSQNPVSDLMYDWITVLQSKAEGINAYEKYIRDAEEEGDMESAELFRKFREQDIWQVKEIQQHMEQLILEAEESRFNRGRMHFSGMRSGEEEGEEA